MDYIIAPAERPRIPVTRIECRRSAVHAVYSSATVHLSITLWLAAACTGVIADDFAIRQRNVAGNSYLFLDDVATYYSMHLGQTSNSIRLWSDRGRIELEAGSRRGTINNFGVHLSFKPIIDGERALISEVDFRALLDPLLRDAALPQRVLKRIVIDAGHGGKDNGAIGSHFREKDMNLVLARQLQQILESSGYEVLLTRTDDTYIPLAERGHIAMRWGGDLFVSIHCNAAHNNRVMGIETFIVTPPNAPSTGKNHVNRTTVTGNENAPLNARLAFEIHRQLITQTQAVDRGIKSYRWQVLREAHCPAVLLECGFLSNHDEESRLGNPRYQHILVVAIANGIIMYHHALAGRANTVDSR